METTPNPDLGVDRAELRPASFVLDHYEHRIQTLEAELRAARAALIAIQALVKSALPENDGPLQRGFGNNGS